MATVTKASVEDAGAILALQKLAYQSEARLYNDWSLPPLTQSLPSLLEEFTSSVVLKANVGERLVGSVRAKTRDGVCEIGRLIVDPQFQRQGIGSTLLRAIEASFPDIGAFELFTGQHSDSNIRLYLLHGYTVLRTQALSPTVSLVYMRKPNPIVLPT